MDNIVSQSTYRLHAEYEKYRSGADFKNSQKIKIDQTLKKACVEMESLFIYYLFKEMRATIPKSEFLNGGKGEEIYQSMLDSQLSKELAGKGGIGLSSLIYNQLSGESNNIKKGQ